jgi:hypothetical protein
MHNTHIRALARPLFALLLTVGCEATVHVPTEDESEHGPVFTAEGEDLLSQLTPGGDGWSHLAPLPAETFFDRVGLRFDAKAVVEIEVRTSPDAGETWGTWRPLTLTYKDGIAHNAHADVTNDGMLVELRFRAPVEAELSFVTVELIEKTAAVAEDEAQIDLEQSGTEQGLATDGLLVTREQWGARQRVCGSIHTPNKITIHHTVTPNNDSMSMPARMRQIQAFHIDSRGWCDIGYHFLIGQDGKVYQGRYENRSGAHAANANINNAGISFIGDYTTVTPTDAMLDAAASIVDALASAYNISRNRTFIKGHREVGTTSTSCPGNKLFGLLQNIIDRSNGAAPPPSSGPASCHSSTIGQVVEDGTCVQVSYAGCGLDECAWYRCNDGAWQCSDLDACNEETFSNANCAAEAPVSSTTYSDLPSSHWAYGAAEALRANAAMWGCETGKFCPDQLITRAEVAYTLAALVNTSVTMPSSALFTDVPSSAWYYQAVQEVAARNVTQGCGGTQFCPNGTVSRAAGAVFVRRAKSMAVDAAASQTFVDVATDHWAFLSIDAAFKAGDIVGCSTSPLKYCPDDMMTRAEAAVLLARAFDVE